MKPSERIRLAVNKHVDWTGRAPTSLGTHAFIEEARKILDEQEDRIAKLESNQAKNEAD